MLTLSERGLRRLKQDISDVKRALRNMSFTPVARSPNGRKIQEAKIVTMAGRVSSLVRRANALGIVNATLMAKANIWDLGELEPKIVVFTSRFSSPPQFWIQADNGSIRSPHNHFLAAVGHVGNMTRRALGGDPSHNIYGQTEWQPRMLAPK